MSDSENWGAQTLHVPTHVCDSHVPNTGLTNVSKWLLFHMGNSLNGQVTWFFRNDYTKYFMFQQA